MENSSGVSQQEKEFIQNFAKEAGEWLPVFLPGKPGAFKPVVNRLADKLWEVKIPVSNSVAALLPFLPETMQKACADKSRAEIEAFRNKFGEDAMKWPRDTACLD